MSTNQEQLKKLLEEPLQEVERKQEPLLNVLRNVQGNILHGHGRNFAAHIFLKFGGDKDKDVVEEVKQVLRKHIICKDTFNEQLAEKKVMSAQELLDERETERETGRKNRESLFVSFLVSARGYYYFLKMTPEKFSEAYPEFIQEFRDGMNNDQTRERLQDPPHPSWGPKYEEDQEIHAMILFAHQEKETLHKKEKELSDDIKHLTKRYWVEWGNILRNKDGLREEHFGYVDGHSQPLFFQKDLDKEEQERGMDYWDPSAGPDLVLTPDPLGKGMDYGSYFVFRKLQQDVIRFEALSKTLAAELGIDKEQAKALVMGRSPDGEPLASHNTPTPKVYQNSHNAVPNNFRYDQDLDGQLCPYHAHIRRMNPRRYAGGLKYDRRIVRRGIPYGKKDEPQVGLLFMCYQQNLATQFEALQGQWAYKPPYNSISSQSGHDPLIGVMSGVKVDRQQWPKPGGATKERVPVRIGSFVTLMGGEYFFAPSINVLTQTLLH